MKTRFQRLSFAVGLSLIIGALVGADDIEYNFPYAIATSLAVFGLCLMINAFVKEDSNKAE
jgi:hypothetical protein